MPRLLFLLILIGSFSKAFSQCTNIPIIKINTLGQTISDNVRILCDMGIVDNGSNQNCVSDAANNYNGKITIEYRGSTSQSFPKKPYGFSTVDASGNNLNVSLLGMPDEHDWILLNPYTDKSFMRDVILYNLANKMGWYASRTQFVELYIDNSPQGIYVLLEKIKRDPNRVDIEKMDTTMNSGDALTGGYIFKIDKLTGSSSNYWYSNQNVTYLNHYPDEDDITTAQNNYLHNYINSFENALYGPNYLSAANGYRKYANVNSFVDFLILNEVANNVDGYRLSTFMHKDRDSKCGRFTMGPIWDNNLSLGNADYCNADTAGWRYVQGCYNYYGMAFYLQQMSTDPYFNHVLHCRWSELRNGILRTDSVLANVDAYRNLLNGPKDLDSTLWQTIGYYIWPNQWVASSWQGEIDLMKQWITGRLNWLDNNMPNSPLPCGGNSPLTVVIDEINYHSDSTLNAGDWIELYNYGSAAVDISQSVLSDGVSLEKYCVLPANTILQAGQRLVVYEDSLKFATVHPSVTNKLGPLCFKLDNNGQHIELRDSNDAFVYGVTYNDEYPWAEICDGHGRTLQLVNFANIPDLPSSWKAGCVGGSPGLPYSPCTKENPIVTEINYQSSMSQDAGDWIELYNTSSNPLNLGGYNVKTSSSQTLYTIPSNITIPPHQYLILQADNVKFASIYPSVTATTGPNNMDLNNSKDIVKIYDNSGEVQYSLLYETSNNWPAQGNGTSRTMDNINYIANQNNPNTWVDGCLLGSPGQAYDPQCKPLGLTSADKQHQITLYPNPTNDVLYIQSQQAFVDLRVVDVTGKILLQYQSPHSISLASLSPGTYWIQLRNEQGQVFTQSVMKE